MLTDVLKVSIYQIRPKQGTCLFIRRLWANLSKCKLLVAALLKFSSSSWYSNMLYLLTQTNRGCAGAAGVLTVAADVSTAEGNKAMIDAAMAEFGEVHGLFANAGAFPPLADAPP
jgi:NAD(P)-dependent dehydrogenase (short-subunit alcohol dehydrogenase family)